MKKIYNICLVLSFFLFIVFLPFNFFLLFKAKLFGQLLTIKLPHIFLFISVPFLLKKEFRNRMFKFLSFGTFHISFIALLFSYGVSLFWSDYLSGGVIMLLKNILNYLIFLLLSVVIWEMLQKKMEDKFLLFAQISLLFYFLYLLIGYHSLEISFISKVYTDLTNGEIQELRGMPRFDIFSTNFFGEENINIERVYNPSRMSGILLLILFCLNIFDKSSKGGLRYFFNLLLKIIAVILILLTFNRAAFLVVLVMGIAGIYNFISALVLKKFLLIGLVTLAMFTMLITLTSDIGQILFSRFSQNEFSHSARIITAKTTLEKIYKKPMLGYGYGVKVKEIPNAGIMKYVHNLILGSWYSSGLLGLIGSIIFYSSILLLFIRTVLKKIREGGNISFWVTILPIYPLITAMVVGSNGSFRIMDWAFLSFFFGFILYNENDLKNDLDSLHGI